LLTARYKHSEGLLPDGRVLIAGGSDDRDWTGKLNTAEIYDPEKQTFTAASPLNESRFKLPEAVQLSSGQLLFAGGSKTVEVYDHVSRKFLIASGEMDTARHFMTATKLNDGSVLLERRQRPFSRRLSRHRPLCDRNLDLSSVAVRQLNRTNLARSLDRAAATFITFHFCQFASSRASA
jgi:Kelch motif